MAGLLPIAAARPLADSPLVVSYGAGVDSTAMLVGLHRRGIRPDLIVFSDTGAEKPETYAALDAADRWLEAVGFPTVTRTRYNVVEARYTTLEGNCLQNDGLPSLAYGHHSCSLKWKIQSIDDHVWGVRGWQPALDALHAGRQVVRAIGYDDGKADRRRFGKVEKLEKAEAAKGEWSPWHNWYPLQAWGWKRADCLEAIRSETQLGDYLEAVGLAGRAPVKSACFFCPATKPHELLELARDHPELALRAVVMEFRAETGKHGLKTLNGLGLGREEGARKGSRNFSWRRLLLAEGLLAADWRERAEALDLLPPRIIWDAYAASCARLRDRIEAAKLAGDVELSARLKIEKRDTLGPDWAATDRPVKCKEAARERRAAQKAWRDAVKAAKLINAAKLSRSIAA